MFRRWLDTIDNFNKNTVHKIWFARQCPTVDKVFPAVSFDDSLPPICRINLFHLLKPLDFRYTKLNQNAALTKKKTN